MSQELFYKLASIFLAIVTLIIFAQVIAKVWYFQVRKSIKDYKEPSLGIRRYSVLKKILKKPLQFVKLASLSVAVLALTLLILLNTYSLIANYPLPIFTSVNAYPAQEAMTLLTDNRYFNPNGATYDGLGRNRTFTTLKLPKQNVRVDLLPLILKDEGFLSRINSGHYLFTSETEGSKADQLLIYLAKSWRTINYPEDIVEGDFIYLQKDDGSNAIFKVKENTRRSLDQSYLPQATKNLSLILLIADEAKGVTYFIQAEYIDIS
jgi:hypothetical protein